MRICIVYICAYIVLVCIGIYIYAHVHFCAVATLSRGALLFLAYLCNLCSMFLIKPLFMLFCPFARFASRSSSLHHLVILLPFLRTFCRTFAAKHLQRSFYTVFSRFKRSKFLACTFVHFAPFQAVTWQQTWQNAVIRGRVGRPPLMASSARRN